MLSDMKIKQLVDAGWLVDNLAKNALQPSSIDCTLGYEFMTVHRENNVIDMNSPIKYQETFASRYVIPPLSFVLATTVETIRLPNNISAYVEGRSSIARMGLTVQTAGFVDPGFIGKITLELFNANNIPMVIHAGRRICQLVFFEINGFVANPYKGKYQNQNKTKGSSIHLDEENQ